MNNWLILRSEKYKEYYVYQPQLDLWLRPGNPPELVSQPCAVSITRSSSGFLIGIGSDRISIDARKEEPVGRGGSAGDGTRMELIHNYAMDYPEDVIVALLAAAEDAVHGGNGIKDLKGLNLIHDARWHELGGRTVPTPDRPGLYIVNGRKVLVR